MSGPQRMGPRTFDVDELGSIDPGDRAAAIEASRRLQSIDDPSILPSAGFSDRVMASIATEPNPAPTGFLAPLRRRGIVAGFAASVREAWASVGGTGRPVLARGAALAYVLAVAVAGTSLAGVAAVGAAGALGILDPAATESPAPSPTLPPEPTLAPEPTLGPEPSIPPPTEPPPSPVAPSPSPSESPDESDDHGGGDAEPSDDSGGSSGSDDSAKDTEPSDTPRPTGTPKPTETPH